MASENGENGAVGRVKIVSKSKVVVPNGHFEKRECPLVSFDLPYVTFYYNQKLLLYRGGNFEEMVGKLKEGLGLVLEHFYPLAGKLAKDEEGVLMVVECDVEDGGVEVIEAFADGIDVAELSEDEASTVLQEIVPCTGIMNLEGLDRPLLAVQFTKLRDGLAIGCAFNHAIVDGHSTWHFMSAWAEICRGSHTISLPPFHDRTQARNTRVKLDLPVSAAAFEKSGNKENGGDIRGPPKDLRERIFRFSEKAIERIKSEVNARLSGSGSEEEGSKPKPLSAFQSLGAHLWHAVTRARHLKPEDYTVFVFFMDCRRRVDPPMPESYFGNLIQAIFTVMPAGLLLANPPDFVAGTLQQLIRSHDSKAIEARSKEWENAPKLFHYKDAGINTVTVGSSPRFPVYDVDFGWGKPVVVRSGSNNKFDGMVYLYQGRDGGNGVEVEITLEKETMENLEKDEDFLMV